MIKYIVVENERLYYIFADPKTLSADFANGYLIGEMLHKYQLQDDFEQFSKGR